MCIWSYRLSIMDLSTCSTSASVSSLAHTCKYVDAVDQLGQVTVVGSMLWSDYSIIQSDLDEVGVHYYAIDGGTTNNKSLAIVTL